MRKIIRSIALLVVVFFANGCSQSTSVLPTLHDLTENSFIAYDETILSGKQVDKVLDRYTEFVSIIVVKDGKDYVFGGDSILTDSDLKRRIINDTFDKETLINVNATYKSLVLRDLNNDIVGIKLIENIP
ncbi:hypothetical protein SAMN05428961_11335 [Paenibacillus sp. OK060]|uniref:hypothetical protein n=1 Tax=Paenibacillus sp. OK060 TaxID=1881034 RepID=UPI00088BC0BF|nr:hypothetical protein [Paenibacillus sp. OK060]SDM30294.1 hypothetical protein SAMN05428961_11335 [Paenibacillus sp. OK060]